MFGVSNATLGEIGEQHVITLTADNTTLAILRQTTELVEVHDAKGTLVGYFAPVRAERAHLYDPPYPTTRATEADLAEIERQKASETGGKTLREAFEHLLSLTDEEKSRADLRMHIDRLKKDEEGIEE
jgi:hypothetical protein